MRAVGIISEYNPFHTGHAHQLETARRDTGADVIVAVMSEHATQRGELAVADGYVRAEAAIRAGVDLVIGLPFPYSASSAEFFASAAVRILNSLNVTALHFGSECNNIELLHSTVDRLYSPDFTAALFEYRQNHPTSGIMECRAALYRQICNEPLPTGSNDLLAMAYLRALATTHSTMQAYTTERRGQPYHDFAAPEIGRYPSATALRTLWDAKGLAALHPHLPKTVFDVLVRAQDDGLAPIRASALGNAFLAFYRTADPNILNQYADLDGGLAERLCHAAERAMDLSSMLATAATRRYTNGRLNRALLYGVCGVRSERLLAPPAYVRLLGANKIGCAYLASIRKSCTLPIVTKPADIPTSLAARQQRELEQRFESLLALALPVPQDSAFLLRRKPFIAPTEQ